ncbi:MAG TPA: tetratricopeptide repeat protein [Terriglobales bacterium]|nr:tetratricopeptide repeat protein [Terriglobales bacterium]
MVYGNQIYCPNCKEFLRVETVPGARPAALIDPTICARCGADNGNSEYQRLGALPFCQTCHSYVSAHPYPAWLKAGLLALLALLVVALVHGRRYFSAGRQMYIGEKLVEEGKYAEAIGYLKQTVQVAPGSDKAALLLAKAALLSGDPNTASDALRGHSNGRGFSEDSEVQEVTNLFARTDPALVKAKKAIDLAQQSGKAAEAATLMHQAADEYPEMSALRDNLPGFDAGAAFENKDYDQFLALSDKQFQKVPESGDAAGAVASALACKYAVTGDPSWKQRAEDMLEKARQPKKGLLA